MIVKKLRLQKCWSQEQLSQFSGLSVRTIQRIEQGQQASLESLKSLAAVFQINLNDLQSENDMNTQTNNKTNSDNINNDNTQTVQLNIEEKKAMEYVEGIKSFYQHLFSYIPTMAILVVINFLFTPDFFWVLFPIIGWGIGIISHGAQAFELFSLFSPEWEKKQIEKRLGREL